MRWKTPSTVNKQSAVDDFAPPAFRPIVPSRGQIRQTEAAEWLANVSTMKTAPVQYAPGADALSANGGIQETRHAELSQFSLIRVNPSFGGLGRAFIWAAPVIPDSLTLCTQPAG